jgi:peptide/nickel transport system permease protein
VLALALVAVLQDRVSDLLTLVLALGIISIPVLARITRANAIVWSQREFVTAARALGIVREAGIAFRPTWVAFTPLTSL